MERPEPCHTGGEMETPRTQYATTIDGLAIAYAVHGVQMRNHIDKVSM